jgi:hypothetical protein
VDYALVALGSVFVRISATTAKVADRSPRVAFPLGTSETRRRPTLFPELTLSPCLLPLAKHATNRRLSLFRFPREDQARTSSTHRPRGNRLEGGPGHETIFFRAVSRLEFSPRFLILVAAFLGAPVFAANSPWENAVGVLQRVFTSTIARGPVARRHRGLGIDLRLRRGWLKARAPWAPSPYIP